MQEANHPAAFPPTQWTVVLQVRANGDADGAGRALEQLCSNYWYPLYAYIRRRGFSAADSQDLAQSFFAYALSKNLFASAEPTLGKLRTFLLTALERFISDEQKREARNKRGGGYTFISLDSGEARYAEEPLDVASPAVLFERTWAFTLIEATLQSLRDEESAAGRAKAFANLEPFLSPDANGEADYPTLAKQLNVTADNARQIVRRLRARFRDLLRRQIASTLRNPDDTHIDEELAALRSALVGSI